MLNNLSEYKTLVFDCDGVVLNSNKVKTQAFYNSTLPFGKSAAKAMVDYHIKNGGISRYSKFDYFLKSIAPEYAGNPDVLSIKELLSIYAEEVRKGLLSCEITNGLSVLREQTSDSRWMIVSGGDQKELREIFKVRNIDQYFDGGIFGSPATKDEILNELTIDGRLQKPALFIGDSKYDFEAASGADLDFVFIRAWSEVDDIDSWLMLNGIYGLNFVSDLSETMWKK
ncbi:HAD family hydrolase [Marinospirillum alkaliphilum]|uniref:phosphoglycolate phosphatase n=1 Tax=Marinospirillum alkaliphilum DSM 21637 TaxID=1122209 RepID=A0A1K1U8Z7_9GAMM|nr:HAD hydrolase-like protein [Marinospirillum alkaliphilum]SFX08853.1 Phosphoglycolate phosphatase, HAD superfamily [Marinospirillum alkaliphilum DSM 21637]